MVTTSRSRLERVRPTSVKDRILESAIEEFAGLGYHGSSLRSIAERSQATKPMIYYHYQGKDGLFAAAIRHQLERLEEELKSRIDDEGDTLARLEAFARTYMACFLFDHPALAVGLRELPTLPALVFEVIARDHGRMVVAVLKKILRDGEERGDLRQLDIDNCTRAVIGVMHYYIRGSGLDAWSAVEAATSQIVDYYAVGMLSAKQLSRRNGR